jgi:hypothetical protein
MASQRGSSFSNAALVTAVALMGKPLQSGITGESQTRRIQSGGDADGKDDQYFAHLLPPAFIAIAQNNVASTTETHARNKSSQAGLVSWFCSTEVFG